MKITSSTQLRKAWNSVDPTVALISFYVEIRRDFRGQSLIIIAHSSRKEIFYEIWQRYLRILNTEDPV